MHIQFQLMLIPTPIDAHPNQVEKRFYIPRSSQNWIIGKKLIKGDDELHKALSQHGLKCPSDSTSVKVFLYVMHTKKANVAKEEYDAIQSRRKEQQNRQENVQSGGQPPPTSGPPPGNINQGSFPQGQRMKLGGPPHGQQAGDPNQSSFPQGYAQDQRYAAQDYGRQPVQGNVQGNQGNIQGYHGNVQGNQGNMMGNLQQQQRRRVQGKLRKCDSSMHNNTVESGIQAPKTFKHPLTFKHLPRCSPCTWHLGTYSNCT